MIRDSNGTNENINLTVYTISVNFNLVACNAICTVYVQDLKELRHLMVCLVQ